MQILGIDVEAEVVGEDVIWMLAVGSWQRSIMEGEGEVNPDEICSE